jgi:hypothetical protein
LPHLHLDLGEAHDFARLGRQAVDGRRWQEREGARVLVCVCVRVCVRACVSACICVCIKQSTVGDCKNAKVCV